MKQDHLKCSVKNCKYTGPVMHFAFIYNKTLCPKCATMAINRKISANKWKKVKKNEKKPLHFGKTVIEYTY